MAKIIFQVDTWWWQKPCVEFKRRETSNSNRIELVRSFDILKWCNLSAGQSHSILGKNWKRKFSSNSCIPHGKSYFRRQETNFSSESPNQPSLDFFGMKQPFWERNKEKKMNHSEVKIIGRHAWWTWICLSVPNTWKHLFCVWFLSLRLSDVYQDQ